MLDDASGPRIIAEYATAEYIRQGRTRGLTEETVRPRVPAMSAAPTQRLRPLYMTRSRVPANRGRPTKTRRRKTHKKERQEHGRPAREVEQDDEAGGIRKGQKAEEEREIRLKEKILVHLGPPSGGRDFFFFVLFYGFLLFLRFLIYFWVTCLCSFV